MNGPSGFEEGLAEVELKERARALPDKVRNEHRDRDAAWAVENSSPSSRKEK